MVLLLASSKDPAAVNIQTYLQNTYDFHESSVNCTVGSLLECRGVLLLEIDEEILTTDLNHVEVEINSDLILVLSCHRAESGAPALLAHPQGNWIKNAPMGGQPETLSMTSATALKLSVTALREQKIRLGLQDYLCGLEVTHHGPTTETPMIFVEIGSTEREWQKPKPAEAVGEAVMYVARNWAPTSPAVIGVGGTHYAPRFNELIHRTELAVGHIIPKYNLDTVDLFKMLQQAALKTFEKVEICAYDHGGTKSIQRQRAREAAKNMDLEFMRIRDLLRSQE